MLQERKENFTNFLGRSEKQRLNLNFCSFLINFKKLQEYLQNSTNLTVTLQINLSTLALLIHCSIDLCLFITSKSNTF